MPDKLDDRLRAELRGDAVPPAWLYERVAVGIRETPQGRRPLLPARTLAAVAAVLLVAVLVTGGPLLYGTLVGPRATDRPATPSPAPATLGPSSAAPTPSPSPTAPPIPTPTPLPPPTGTPNLTFNLLGTAWSLLQLPGQALTPEATPTIEFDLLGNATAYGWSGCSSFSMVAVLADGRVDLIGVGAMDRCRTGDADSRFLDLLRNAATWAVHAGGGPLGQDVLVLAGPAGTLQFERRAPSGGAARQVFDALRASAWRVAAATGIRQPGLFGSLRFGDRQYFAQGTCGFSGNLEFTGNGGQLRLDVGFDTIRCGDVDERAELSALAGTITSAALEGSTAVRLRGAGGEILLARVGLASSGATPAPSVPTGVVRPVSLAFLSPQVAVMSAMASAPSGVQDWTLSRSTDGGRTWTVTHRAEGAIWELTSVQGTGAAWAVARCAGASLACNALLRTTDGGRTWTSVPAPFAWHVGFGDTERGWGVFGVAGSQLTSALRYTEDGGTSWSDAQTQPCALLPGWRLARVVAGPAVALALCLGDETSDGRSTAIVRSTDEGLTWQVVASTGDAATGLPPVGSMSRVGTVEQLGLAPDGSAWMADTGHTLYRSANLATWTSTSLTAFDGLVATTFVDAQRGFAIVLEPGAYVLRATADAGKSWTEVSRWVIDT